MFGFFDRIIMNLSHKSVMITLLIFFLPLWSILPPVFEFRKDVCREVEYPPATCSLECIGDCPWNLGAPFPYLSLEKRWDVITQSPQGIPYRTDRIAVFFHLKSFLGNILVWIFCLWAYKE